MKIALIAVGIIIAATLAYFGLRNTYEPTEEKSSSTIETTQVSIQNFSFDPNAISVTVGQEVSFTNNDSVAHTVTAEDNSFDSGTINPGETYKRTFDKAGTFSYYCTLHPAMRGKIEVK